MPLWWPLVLSGLLFAIGVYGVLVRRNAVVVLMLNVVNINLVAFDAHLRDVVHGGQTLALFVVVIAAAEIGLALAIVLRVFRTHGHIEVDALRELADRDATPAQPDAVPEDADAAATDLEAQAAQ